MSKDYAEYLSNLLIIQYAQKPKATATVKAIGEDFPDDLIFAVRDGFSLESAEGKQLDILGKYVGTDRFFIDTNGNLVALTDEEFRILLKLKAIANTSNSSHYDIDTALQNFFGNSVHAESRGDMEMTYFIPANAERVIIAAIAKDVLPRPMGVGLNYVIVQNNPMFAFATYDNQYAFYRTGFRTYNDPNKKGEIMTYNKVVRITGD